MALNSSTPPAISNGIPTGTNILSTTTNRTGLNTFGSLNFPQDLGKPNFNFWMSFSFYQYNAPSFLDTGILSDLGTIRLPLPNNLDDKQEVRYEEAESGMALGAGLSAATAAGGGATGAAAGIGAAAIAALAKGLSNMPGAQKVINEIQNTFGQNAGAVVLQQGGLAVNPFLTVLFKSPKFKRHTFSWRLSPSNDTESIILNKILNTFRYNQLPDAISTSGAALLTYPNIVQLTLSNNSATNFTYVFKPAVIESFDINFTPSGQPSFFGSTSAPTEVGITLSLLEIEFWLQRDYGTQQQNNAQALINKIGQSAYNLLIGK